MSTVTPPPPPAPPSAPPAVQPTAQAINPPAGLTALPPGTPIEAQIQIQATRGVIQIQTVYGTLQIQSAFSFPKTAATLLLTIQSLTPALLFQITAIDGKPVSPRGATVGGGAPRLLSGSGKASVISGSGKAAVASLPGSGGASPAPKGGTTASPTDTVGGLRPGAAVPGAVLGARVLSPVAGARFAPPTPVSTGPAGMTSAAKAGISALGRLFSRSMAPGSGGTKGPTTPPASGPLGGNTPVPFQPGATLRLRVASVLPPVSSSAGTGVTGPQTPGDAAPSPSKMATSAPPLFRAGSVVNGTIGGRTSQGLPVVTTNLGALALVTKAPLAEGTRISFEITETPVKFSPSPASAGFWLREGLAQRDMNWASLNDAIDVLAKAAPEAHQTLLKTALPSANNRMGANMLFFLSALRSGDIRSWMGDAAAKVLKARAPDVLTRLSDDFTRLSRTRDEPVAGDWRLTMFPFFTGESIEPVRLFMRGRQQTGDEDNPGSTRFVLDVNLSRIGRMQLDGLVRADRNHVNLIVRTDRPLPVEIRQDITAIFQEASDLTGMKGGLAFQAAPAEFVDVSDGGTVPLPAGIDI